MSTSYNITNALSLEEHSSEVNFCLFTDDGLAILSEVLDLDSLRHAIIKQIEVLSYISDDSERELKRFNVNYGDKE